jgi:hypothetical protein
MPLPFVLSPYLRPYREGGALLLDNGITSRQERLDPIAAQVVTALWDEAGAEAALQALCARIGMPALEAALAQLFQVGVLFESRAACDAVFDQVLDATLPQVPFVDQVELTNLCPMRCGFCPRGVPGGMGRPTGYMDLALYGRLLAQLPPLQARYRPLELHHLGESLLHPQVDRFVALASERGLPTEMSVNPSLLTPELAGRLLAAGIGRLVLSLDGVDDDTLVAIRGPAARYGKAERHIEALLSQVAGMARPPRVVIQMIDLQRNRHQREAFLARWGRTGLPTVVAYVKDLDGPDPDTGLSTATPVQYLCSYPFRSVVVLWDGRVVPCCRDDDARLVLGDLTQASLAEIWAGPAAAELRRRHRTADFGCGHLCAGCAWQRGRYAQDMGQRHPDRAREEPLRW